jgi:hypothetical protein
MFPHQRRMVAQASLLVAIVALTLGPEAAGAAKASVVATRYGNQQRPGLVRVILLRPVIDLYGSDAITVDGLNARTAQVRLLGAIDRRGLAYEWTPYPWRRLRLVHDSWRGLLVPPPQLGIFQLQLRLDNGRTLLTSPRWLLRVFEASTRSRQSYPTAIAAVRGYVAHLAGNQHLVAVKRWPFASFDHRDPRLHHLFVIAYAPRGDRRPDSRRGLFVTTVRDGFGGPWRLLEATTQPYG